MAKILVVGATSTVASIFAQARAKSGDELFCLARNEEKLAGLTDSFPEAVKGVHCFDFNATDIATIAVKKAVECLGAIDIVLIAHGDLTPQIESEQNFQIAKSAFDINLLSVIALLIPIAEQMVAQGYGKIGVITSVAGDRGRPRNYTYGAAKGALSLYLQGLRSTLWQSGVEIYDFKSGPVDTPMSASHEKNFSFSSPELVASEIWNAFQRRKFCVYIPGYWRWVMLCVRNMPECIFQRLKFLSAR